MDQLQRSLRVLRVALVGVVLISVCGAYAANAFLPTTKAAPSRVCHQDGKTHSIGSVVRMSDNAIYECSASTSPGGGAAWQPARNLGSGGKRRF